jgi:hypothetical protein
MRRPIENNASPGQAVYEPFSGSGTTHSTGFCVPWPVSDFKFLSICHNVI